MRQVVRRWSAIALIAALSVAAGLSSSSARAAGCEVTTTSGGGIVTACPDAASYDAFLDALAVAWQAVQASVDSGSVSITAEPAGARVLIDGVQVGVAPLKQPIAPGTYLLRVEQNGYESQSKTISVVSGSDTAVSVKLTEAKVESTFQWARAGTFLDLVGMPGGPFRISDFSTDREGNYYVVFNTSVEKGYDLAVGLEDAELPLDLQTKEDRGLSTRGVAMSTDRGVTWSLVASWTEEYDVRGWVSEKFDDSKWPDQDTRKQLGLPDIQSSWVRIFYTERKSSSTFIRSLLPRQDGGMVVLYTKSTLHTPQEIVRIYDPLKNIRQAYAQARTPVPEVLNYTLIRRHSDPNSPFATESTGEGESRYGMSAKDLENYKPRRETEWFAMSPGHFGETPVTISSASNYVELAYEGARGKDHYFLARDPTVTGSGAAATERKLIFVSSDDGRTIKEVASYVVTSDEARANYKEELRIDPEGNFFTLEHNPRGILKAVKDGKRTVVAEVPEAVNAGVAGGNNLPSAVVQFDDAGNTHWLVRRSSATGSQGSLPDIELFYQYVPKDKFTYDSAMLFTQPNCKLCDELKEYLTAAGVAFTENPSLDAAAKAQLETTARASGYPVVARVKGGERVFASGADLLAVNRVLGVAYPRKIATYTPRKANSGGALAQWVWMYLEAGQPRVIADTDEGVKLYTPAPGEWTARVLMESPPAVKDIPGSVIYSKWYPFVIGARRYNLFAVTARDTAFKPPEDPDDFVFMYESAINSRRAGRDEVGFFESSSSPTTIDSYDYTINTTTPPPQEPTGSRIIVPASQLIPGGIFYVPLGKGTAAAVQGELAAYVAEQGVVNEGGEAYYRVKADLRKQGESAVYGNIQSRMVGGFVEVTVDGESAPVNLFLNVSNTRLRAPDPSSPLNARDITSEAVHFDDGRWVVTNNLPVPNVIPCSAAPITVPPNSQVTLNVAAADQDRVAGCLAGIQADPVQVPDCTSWDDAKLVIAAENMEAFASSLPLYLDESGKTNYELFFGKADASIFRTVDVDGFRLPGGGPVCPAEVAGVPAVVLQFTGKIIGVGDEEYRPAIATVVTGTVDTRVQPTGQAHLLASDAEWLEFESEFLRANLKFIAQDARTAELVWGSATARKIRYSRELLAVQAFLHCARSGPSVAAVVQYLDRAAELSPASPRTASCIADFLKDPKRYWPSYDKSYWGSGAATASLTANFVSGVLKWATETNPTLAYLRSSSKGEYADFRTSFLRHAESLEKQGDPGDIAQLLPIDLALDVYGRLRTVIIRDSQDPRTVISHAVLFMDPVLREVFTSDLVTQCLKGVGGVNPVKAALEKIVLAADYKAGLPCVDSESGSAARTKRYQSLGLALHSEAFQELLKLSQNDLDLLYAYLGVLKSAIPAVQAHEAKYKGAASLSVESASWAAGDTSAAEMLAAVHVKMASLAEAKTKTLQSLEVFSLCMGGVVKGVFSPEGLAFLGVTGVAVLAAPATGGGSVAVAFPMMAGAGVILTGYGAFDLAQQWENLSSTERQVAGCQLGVGALFTAAGVKSSLIPAVPKFTAAVIKANPTRLIRAASLPRFTRSSAPGTPGLVNRIAARGGSLVQQIRGTVALEPLVRGMPAPRRVAVVKAAEALKYGELASANPEGKVVIDELVAEFRKAGGLTEVHNKRLSRLKEYGPPKPGEEPANPAKYAAWDEVGAALILELVPDRPRSLRVSVVGGRLTGADASLVKAFLSDPGPRNNNLLIGFLNSERAVQAVKKPGASASLLSVEEQNFLARVIREAQGATAAETAKVLLPELGQTRIVGALSEAVRAEAARQKVAVGSASELTNVESIRVEPLSAGAFKEVSKVEVRVKGVEKPLEMVIKKGEISVSEFELLKELGDLDLTQKPLHARLIEGVEPERVSGGKTVPAEAVSIEEFVPGETWGRLERTVGVDTAEISRAIGELDAKLYLKTRKAVDGQQKGYWNGDLHTANIKLYRDSSGKLVARIVDFDPRPVFFKVVNQDQYFFSSAARRSFVQGVVTRFHVSDFPAYLEGTLRGFESHPGAGKAQGLAVLKRTLEQYRAPAPAPEWFTPGETAVGEQVSVGAARASAAERLIVANHLDAYIKKAETAP